MAVTPLLSMEFTSAKDEEREEHSPQLAIATVPTGKLEAVTNTIRSVLLGRKEDFAEIERVLVDSKIIRPVNENTLAADAVTLRRRIVSTSHVTLCSFWITAIVLQMVLAAHPSVQAASRSDRGYSQVASHTRSEDIYIYTVMCKAARAA